MRIEARIHSMTASYSDMPRGGGKRKDWTDLVAKDMEMCEEIAAERDELSAVRRDILYAIEALENDDQRTVLESRYMNGWSWNRIITEMGRSDSDIYWIHGNALRAIRIPEKYLDK